MIHVCFALYDKTGLFSKFTGTTMLSLFDNTTSEVTAHILHDNTLTQDNREKFTYIAGCYGQHVKFYNVEELCANEIAEINELCARAVRLRFSIAMFYRFFITDVLSRDIEKIIYLDSDIIVNLDIKELWRIELGEKVLGVITIKSQKQNVPGDDGFNSGVLLINMPAFRDSKETLKAGIKLISENLQYEATDQEILNYCFAKNSLQLPVKFNRLVKWSRYYKETQIDRMIYHYNSHLSTKGLGLDMSDPFNRLWMSYFIRTPFFDENSIERLYESFKKIRDDLVKHRMKIASIVSGKTRAFFVEPAKIKARKKFFYMRDDELIIPAEDESSLQKLIDAMKSSQGKYVFFILTEKFMKGDFPIERLTSEGFVDGKDFVRGWRFFSEEQGLPFNSNPLIQTL